MVEQCEACGAIGGYQNSFISLSKFRGHNLCPGCCQNWGHKDKALGREATWVEFLLPHSVRQSLALRKRNEEIVQEAKEGKSLDQLSELFGLHERTIHRILVRQRG